MAKIGDLQIGTIKIKHGAITDWFYPTPNGYTLPVTNASGNPTFIWFTGVSTGSIIRDGSTTVGGFGAGDSAVLVDGDPPTNCTYTISPTTSGAFVAAKVRKK